MVQEIAKAMAHVHQHDIIHRDLKPENILLSQSTTKGTVKLIDFGTAMWCGPNDVLSDPCGTLHYVAPEVLRGNYGRPADMWALGVVAFLMIYGAYPFDGNSTTEVIKSILGDQPNWADSCYAVSIEVKDFLHVLLEKEPKKRLTAVEAAKHTWIESATTTEQSKALPLYSLQSYADNDHNSESNPIPSGGNNSAQHDQAHRQSIAKAQRTSCCITQGMLKMAFEENSSLLRNAQTSTGCE